MTGRSNLPRECPPYVTEYRDAIRPPARGELIETVRRESARHPKAYSVHLGAVLSGSARIQSAHFRDELVEALSSTDDPIVGGEMEGVGLLAFSHHDPIWCVVKGISDFADEDRDRVIGEGREIASRNSAGFVLDALANRNRRG
jgi:nucleoside phosphorylase